MVGENYNFRCPTCGEIKSIVATGPIRFGFEVYNLAKDADWYPVFDLNHSRTLPFCSKSCMEKQLTKRGIIRKNLIQVPKEAKINA